MMSRPRRSPLASSLLLAGLCLVGAGSVRADARLHVTSNAPASVQLDGEALGQAPLTAHGLAPGDHLLTVTDSATGEQKTFSVHSPRIATLEKEFYASFGGAPPLPAASAEPPATVVVRQPVPTTVVEELPPQVIYEPVPVAAPTTVIRYSSWGHRRGWGVAYSSGGFPLAPGPAWYPRPYRDTGIVFGLARHHYGPNAGCYGGGSRSRVSIGFSNIW